MSTKLLTVLLSLGLSFTSSNCGQRSLAQDGKTEAVIPVTVTKTQDAIDSVHLMKEQFVTQKEDLKSQISLLERKQKELEKTQKELDSFLRERDITTAH
jgi:peptidoglycan hydrolase CwlO-like protein